MRPERRWRCGGLRDPTGTQRRLGARCAAGGVRGVAIRTRVRVAPPRPMTELEQAAARLRAAGIRRVETYAWRDLDDAEAGGSELHADEIFRRWAGVGIEIVHRTSTADVPREFASPRLPRHPTWRSVRRVPTGCVASGGSATPSRYRHDRDLERGAVAGAGVGAPAAAGVDAPRASRDVGRSAATPVRRDGPHRRDPACTVAVSAQHVRHAVGVVGGRHRGARHRSGVASP